LAFTFRKLTSDHAIEWQTLKLEGVEDFPLGFLITPEEALKTTKGPRKDPFKFWDDTRRFLSQHVGAVLWIPSGTL
jgi:hypothetical protein